MTTIAAASTAYSDLVQHVREADLLRGCGAVLSWDQEVMMPKGGLTYRSRQLALLARLHHERMTDPRLEELLHRCESDRDLMEDARSVAAVNVARLRRDYDRATRLPAELVEEEARLACLGHEVWREARRDSDFARFRPALEELLGLARRKAECYGWAPGGEAWDALAEDYEPGCTAADVARVFGPLRKRLAALVDAIRGATKRPTVRFNAQEIPIERQRAFVAAVARAIGFDFDRGRLDVSTHPFCGGSHRGDVRLTTRFHAADVLDALGSTMHEAGHGMYEQGLLEAHVGTPMGDAVSLGIHESQSRMWENQVGRSAPFWRWAIGPVREHLGAAAEGVSAEQLFAEANVVQPGFIRVEADEATYNLHVMIRFELERGMMSGSLDVADLPEAWNAKYREYLGIEVPDDARGCLQDVHWSSASFGYFPTYTLGNLYSAQLFEAARRAIPDLEEGFARGAFAPLRDWLNANVHAHGRRYQASELCELVTGAALSPDPLLRHLEGKLKPLYGL